MTSTNAWRRLAGALATGLAASLAIVPSAFAHVSVSPSEAPAEGYIKLDFGVGHGCEASPTTSVSIQMPDQVVSATPQELAGWKITTKEGELARPVESHGETITTGVREVTWSGGPLDPHHLGVFGLSVRFVGEPGDVVPFKVVQRCREGENAWIEVAEPGGDEPEHPAPTVTLVAGEDDHGHADAGAAGAADDHADEDRADDHADEDRADDQDDEDDGPLPVIALIVAIVALITAGIALATRRRS